MKTKEEVLKFLDSIQWARLTKKELEKMLQEFFGVKNTLTPSTCEDCKEIDYSFDFTTQEGDEYTNDVYDVEIWYLNMRQRNHIIITGTEILTSPY